MTASGDCQYYRWDFWYGSQAEVLNNDIYENFGNNSESHSVAILRKSYNLSLYAIWGTKGSFLMTSCNIVKERLANELSNTLDHNAFLFIEFLFHLKEPLTFLVDY